MPNAELAYRVLDHIDAHPESWDQNIWVARRPECGTAACFAGWACLLSGDQPAGPLDADNEVERVNVIWLGSTYIPHRAGALLGIEVEGGEHPLFEYTNTREDLGELVEEIFGPRPALVTV